MPEVPVVPRRPRRRFPYTPVVGGLIVVFALTGVGWYLAARKTARSAPPPPPAAAGNYSRDIAAGEARKNEAGRFLAKIPQGWTTREEGMMLSAESPDKALTVDYVRDTRLQQDSVQAIVSLPDAQVQKIDSKKVGPMILTSYVSSAGGRTRYAVLHEPPGDIPGLAMLETSSEVFMKLPRAVIDSLTRDGFRLQPLAPSTPATVPSTPLPEPTQVAQAVTPAPTPEPTPAATPQPTAPPATPAPANTPGPPPATPPVSGFSIASERIQIRLSLPAGWSGESLAEGQVIALRSPSGVEMRLTRENRQIAPKAVFDAMAGEGWDVIARNENRRVGILTSDLAEMKKGSERLILALLGYPDKTTVYIYATHTDKFLAPQREDIARLIQTLAAQEPPPASP
jgi:hypothetical protein